MLGRQFLFDLSLNLKCILAQQLVADANGVGRHGVYELLLNTPRVADLIRRGDLYEIKDVMAKSKNVSNEPRVTSTGDVFINGLRVKAISGVDSSKLKIKTKQK